MNGSKTLVFWEPFWQRKSSLINENVLLEKSFLFVGNFLHQVSSINFCKKLFFVENFHDCGKSPWLSKSPLIKENYHGQRKNPWLCLWPKKSYLIVDRFLDCGKLVQIQSCFYRSSLTVEKLIWPRKIFLTAKNLFSWLQKK